ncbi:Triosephosphate isomerase [Ruegeria sp. THAF57]|uniref:triose-phosphate isomerase n=1 Tax=Ruegeria sp. THAF57 TaxID=2744555 RepID=UPI0015DD6E77|nr:triose-phosphate isomerase [Ruegeria sp. THAF57]CAD0186807.1 Triosephosphate isomerase [Ruegeria sp. THAF57]
MTARRQIAAGNWKMHGCGADLVELAEIASAAKPLSGIVTLLCLPATLLDRARGRGVELGGEDCHAQPSGAHTGDISAQMLRDAGADFVIVGHSERRCDHGESDTDVAAKAMAAWDSGLIAIICIGETEEQYRAGRTEQVLAAQITGSVPDGATPENTVIAYEPVWAIGTGLTPDPEDIQKTHAAIRATLATQHAMGGKMSILYGGSVKPDNAKVIFASPDVDGGLVGGASLKAADFVPIMQALNASKGGNQ